MKYDEIEKQLDEFLASPDVTDEQKDWQLALDHGEKLLALEYDAIDKKTMMRILAKSLTAYTKSVLMCEAILAAYKSTETMRDDVKKIAEKTVSDAENIFEGQNKLIYSLIPAASKGVKFQPKRPKGSLSKKTKYIHKLASDNPNKIAKELYGDADKEIIGKMAEGTFSNHVTKARNLKP